MLRQAREFLAPPALFKSAQEKEQVEGRKQALEWMKRKRKSQKDRKKNTSKSLPVSEKFGAIGAEEAIEKPQSMSYGNKTKLPSNSNDPQHQRRRSRGENPSSSSGGSSSGYLSQANNFAHTSASTSQIKQTDEIEDDSSTLTAADGVFFMTQRSMMPPNHIDDERFRASAQIHMPHEQRSEQQRMMPMMIDDDDDDDSNNNDRVSIGDRVLAVRQHILDDDEDDNRHDQLDHRRHHHQQHQRQHQLHHHHPHRHHKRHDGRLIDNLQHQHDLNDNLSIAFDHQRRSISLAQAQALIALDLQRRRSIPERYCVAAADNGSDEAADCADFDQRLPHPGSGYHHSLNLSGSTLMRPTNQLHDNNYRAHSYNHHDHHRLQQPHSLIGHHAKANQLEQYSDEQQSHTAIYYQANLVNSEHLTHTPQGRPKSATSSFLQHQRVSLPELLAARNKPVPSLPATARKIQHQRPRFATTDARLNHARHLQQPDSRRSANMQTSGSRQNLTSPDRQQQNSSAGLASPHARRNKTALSASNSNQSQISLAKQNLRSVPNNNAYNINQQVASRTTPTPANNLALMSNGPVGERDLGSPSSRAAETGSPMGCCGKLAKFMLFIANALFWSAGIALGAWGILALVEDHKYNLSQLLVFEPGSRASLFQLLSWSFITLGCATILVGFCGCSAMFKNSRWILGLYIFLILAIFALDLATGLLAIIFQERLVANVRLRLVNKLRTEYGIQASFTAAIDYIQTRYECCGLDGHFDYDQSVWRLQRLGGFEATVARTCCHLRNTFDDQAHVNPRPVNESMCQSTDVRFHQSYRYRRGCLDDLERLIRHKIWTFTIGCGAVGGIILLSLVFATCFCRSIPNAGSRKSTASSATGDRIYHQPAAYLETSSKKNRSQGHSTNYR